MMHARGIVLVTSAVHLAWLFKCVSRADTSCNLCTVVNVKVRAAPRLVGIFQAFSFIFGPSWDQPTVRTALFISEGFVGTQPSGPYSLFSFLSAS